MRYLTQALVLPHDGLMPFMTTFKEKGNQTHVTAVLALPQHKNPIKQKYLRFMMMFKGSSMKKEFKMCVDKYFEIVTEAAARQPGGRQSK